MMIGYNKNLSYNSFVKQYLLESFNIDDVQLVYTDRFGKYAFTTVAPIANCKNCDYVNGYPHFDIPIDICLQELDNFIKREPIYDENFIIRYGDIHPNKPMPMLGQLRNIYVDAMIKGLIRTNGEMKNIFTVGDISKKTINQFLESSSLSKEHFESLYNSLMRGNVSHGEILNKYDEFCEDSISITDDILSKLGFTNISFLRESELYKAREIYNFIRNMSYSEGINSNGEIKYFLQEFMFLLHPEFKENFIINIIGQDQSEHIKKVLSVAQENGLDMQTVFLTYNICKNASSRSLDEWEKILDNIIETNNILVDGESVNPFDFMRLYYATIGTDKIVDYADFNKMNLDMFDKIFKSLEKVDTGSVSNGLTSAQLIKKMALINQIYYNALISGNPSKLTRFLYDLSKMYNVVEDPENVYELYNEVMDIALTDLSVGKTKILKRRK